MHEQDRDRARAVGGARVTIVAMAVGAALALMPAVASAATITVDSVADVAGADGTCTLREAITSANSDVASADGSAGECPAGDDAPAADTIAFSIAGAGPHVIVPLTALPLFADPIVLDGSTEPDPVELDGQNLAGEALLNVLAGSSTVRGLYLHSHVGGAVTNDAFIYLQGPGSTVEDVTVGATSAGIAPPNNSKGIGLGSGADDATITGSVLRNVEFDAVALDGADRVEISSNLIGTDSTGIAAAANNNGIVLTQDSDQTVIGGPDPDDGNVIAASDFNGVRITWTPGQDALSGTVIENNLIGVGADGMTPLGNAREGIKATGDAQMGVIRDNVISDNDDAGIRLERNTSQDPGDDGPSDWAIAGNRIGTTADGTAALPNSGTDPAIEIIGSAAHPAARNTIGGTSGLTAGGPCSGDCNLIAGGAAGIELDEGTIAEPGDVVATEILGNFIGTDVTGLNDLEIGTGLAIGISLDGAHDSTVGSAAAPNVIGGGTSFGVRVVGGGGHTLAGNLIGTGADGIADIGNGNHGIYLVTSTTDNVIGGDDAGNVIANNSGDGVFVSDSTTDGNAILGNSIFGNAGLGIDLAPDGATPNDIDESDTGPNDNQNFPVLTGAVAASGTAVAGSLESEPDSDFRIEFFTNTTPDGEGEIFLGSTEVSTDGSGAASFTAHLPVEAGAGDEVTATATSIESGLEDTSEFSAAIIEGAGCGMATAGDDFICGTSGGDAIDGLGGDDVIVGDAGDDTLIGGPGDDLIVGDDGDDEVSYADAAGSVDVNLASESASGDGDGGFDQLVDMEDVTGSTSADVIEGDGAANDLRGGSGDDVLEGAGGSDDARGEGGSDTVRGDDGDDYLTGGDGNDVVQGGDGADEGYGNAGADTVNGNAGNDFAGGADGNDTLKGEAGTDTLKGQAGADSGFGGDGKDTFLMGDGNDTAKGNAGNDKLYGGNGADLLSGLAGFDTAVGHAGNDTLFGGAKKDTLKGRNGGDKLRGNDGFDVLRGGNGKDQLLGHAGKDSLWAQAGNGELCNGGAGMDKSKTTGCEILKKIP